MSQITGHAGGRRAGEVSSQEFWLILILKVGSDFDRQPCSEANTLRHPEVFGDSFTDAL